MGSRRRRGVTIALAFSAGACALGDAPVEPSGDKSIVVQAVLNARTNRQVIWIERLIRAGEPIDPVFSGPVPLDPPPSLVEVRDTAGSVYVFSADTIPARYIADFVPLAGRRYQLIIEAGGRRVTGTTTIPQLVSILDPSADTIDAPTNSLRIQWTREASRRYAWTVTPSDTGQPAAFFSRLWWVGSDTIADIPLYEVRFSAPATLWVMSADSVTADLYDPVRPFSGMRTYAGGNLLGAIGVFGALTYDRLEVRAAVPAR